MNHSLWWIHANFSFEVSSYSGQAVNLPAIRFRSVRRYRPRPIIQRKRTQAILKYFRKNFGIILKPNWKNSWKIWFVLALNDLWLKPLTKWNFWRIIFEILILKLYAITYWMSLKILMSYSLNKCPTKSTSLDLLTDWRTHVFTVEICSEESRIKVQ